MTIIYTFKSVQHSHTIYADRRLRALCVCVRELIAREQFINLPDICLDNARVFARNK